MSENLALVDEQSTVTMNAKGTQNEDTSMNTAMQANKTTPAITITKQGSDIIENGQEVAPVASDVNVDQQLDDIDKEAAKDPNVKTVEESSLEAQTKVKEVKEKIDTLVNDFFTN